MRTPILALLMVLGAALPVGQARGQLHVADLAPLVVQDDPQARLSLLFYGAPLAGFRAMVKELKDPDGASLPTTLLTPVVESQQLSEQGTHVYLQPDLGGFRRPGDYLAVLLVTAGGAPGLPKLATVPAPTVSQLVTVTLRRERPSIHAEPLQLRLVRPLPWRAARLQVAYSLENRGLRPLHSLAIDPQPVTRPAAHDGPAELVPGSLTVVLPPPSPGQALERQRTGQAVELAPSGRLDFSLLLSEMGQVGRFHTGLSLRAPELGAPQIVPITVEVSDRWELALVAIAAGVLVSALFHRLAGRWRPLAENRYRIAHLAHEIEDLRITGAASATARAGFSEKLRRAAQRNQDGEVTLCQRLLDEIDAGLDAYFGAQNELRATARERLDQAQAQTHLLSTLRSALSVDQLSRLKQLRFDLERIAALVGSEQLEAADDALKLVGEQIQATRRALTAPDPDAATLHADAENATRGDGRTLRIEIQEPPSRWRVGSAIRVRVVDERSSRADGDVYLWRFGVATPEPGATEIEYPLDKPGDVEIHLTVRRPDGAEVATARRVITIIAPREPVDLDAAPNPRLRAGRVLTGLSLTLAGLSGVYLLCHSPLLVPLLGPLFGTPAHYLAAIAWGLGLDFLLRGFADTMGRLTADS